ncbi:hypothetical protein [Acinetobacter baumannii]|uniref:hypothetical protein n=1 Tax=Acinetobacter baumannii TaxID=470 RepID=UPI001390452C|nr:hypothetical protein [Acinetobacter baumannii]
MLFSERETESLKYFRHIAYILNDYDYKFNNESILIALKQHYNLDVNSFLILLKDIINKLEILININDDSYSEISSYISRVENELKSDLSNILNTNDISKYFKIILVNIVTFIEFVATWQHKYKVYTDEIGFIGESDSFKMLQRSLYFTIDNISNNALSKIDYLKNVDDQNYYEKVILIEDKLNKLSDSFIILSDDYKNNKNENFEKQKRLFKDRADEAFLSYQSSLLDLKNHYQGELEPQVNELKLKLENNKLELETLLGDVKLYQDKMTNKAVSEMSAHYFDKSKFERNSYFALTLVSAIIIIFSVVSAYIGVNSYYNEYVSTKSCDSSGSRTIKVNEKKMEISFEQCMKDLSIKREATQKYAFNYLIFRLSFSLLLFLAVIYASRIAMRAYNHWRQSENMYLKLNTLSPFIGSLDKSVRNDVHLSLVPDYFGKDAGMVESSKDTVKDLPTNISNIAIKAIEQAGSTIGSKLGSDKETKNSDSESSTEKNKKKSANDPE